MNTVLNTALWMQFGAAIDRLENALLACPEALWRGRLWNVAAGRGVPAGFSEFWQQAYHTIFWLDLYLVGGPEEDFAPPAPFSWVELDSGWALPEQPYTKEQLLDYLAAMRRKCRSTLAGLTDQQAGRTVAYGWTGGQNVSYLELLLYNMRHVQEHAAQLSLFLGQNGVPDEALDAVARAQS